MANDARFSFPSRISQSLKLAGCLILFLLSWSPTQTEALPYASAQILKVDKNLSECGLQQFHPEPGMFVVLEEDLSLLMSPHRVVSRFSSMSVIQQTSSISLTNYVVLQSNTEGIFVVSLPSTLSVFPRLQTETGEYLTYIPNQLLAKCKTNQEELCRDLLKGKRWQYLQRSRIFLIQIHNDECPCSMHAWLQTIDLWMWIDLVPNVAAGWPD